MKLLKGINSKKAGVALAVVFIIGLIVATIYSRGYAERQKPLVQVAFPESGTAVWSYELRSTIEKAGEDFAEFQGAEWTITVYIPYYEFSDYCSVLLSLEAYAISDSVVYPEHISFLRRQVLENGDHIYVFEYTSPNRQAKGQSVWPGEEVTVQLSAWFGDDLYNYLVPYSALHEDVFDGALYLFTVKRRDSAWGREYYAVRQEAEFMHPERIGDLANILHIPPDDPIVIWSDQPIYDGAVVRIYD